MQEITIIIFLIINVINLSVLGLEAPEPTDFNIITKSYLNGRSRIRIHLEIARFANTIKVPVESRDHILSAHFIID